MDKPLISVCTTVYNSETFLRRFIESFLNQTFKESELVLVDNQSTDSSPEIMKSYQERYPDRVRLLRTEEHYGFPAKGRYLAIKNAAADYVYVADSDDEIDVRALEALYGAAVSTFSQKADVVFGNADLIRIDSDGNYKKRAYTHYRNRIVTPEEACFIGVEYWTKLIKKDLFLQVGEIPETIFDDVTYIPILLSHAEHICTIADTVYYYYRRDESLSGGTNVEVIQSSIQAEEYSMAHCSPELRHAVQKLVSLRIMSNLSTRWYFTDYIAAEVRRHYEEFIENPLIQKNPAHIKKFEWVMSLPEELLPDIVYLNGLEHSYTDEELAQIKEKVLTRESKLIVIGRDAPELSEAEGLLPPGYGHRDTAQYIALKRICETGGYFIDDCIQINCFFNLCSCFESFVGMIDANEVCEYVFGGRAGNAFLKKVLETYPSEYLRGQGYDLSKRFKLVLMGDFKAPEHVKRIVTHIPEVAILPPEYFAANVQGKKNICSIDFAKTGAEGLVVIKESTLNYLVSNPSGNVSPDKKQHNYKRELEDIYGSNTWKMASLIRRVGDSRIGPFLKKIMNVFIRLRRRLKNKKKQDRT